jgi:hypothetical protein
MALLGKHDPHFERSLKVNVNLVKDYACCTEIYREKKKTIKLTTYLRQLIPKMTRTIHIY